MSKKELRIVYMGTPEFAVEPLKRLVEEDYNVVGVVTMPDKPAGRGQHVQESPVKKYALSEDIPVLQPEKLRDEDFLVQLKMLQADIQIVVAFRMLPEVVWNMPRLGTFNLHASLLPQYRGAAPINWAIINGEKETGVTTFFLKHEIDTGNIILQRSTPISDDDNVGTLYDRLMNMGAELVVETMERITMGDVSTMPQDDGVAVNPAPKIFKEDCKINWQKSAIELHNFVRGLSPYPAAFTEVKNDKGQVLSLKVLETEVIDQTVSEQPGTLISDGKKQLYFATEEGYLSIKRLQLAGKKAMTTEELLRGTKLFSL
ncbi:MAG: methionyl-tRNA formyltransferase [Paludibacteraceae bacterium]|nr:methionyl-tRNA formyltransferase [Paludibacteraceae bacterium]